jgi:hypothetical protein
VYVCLCVCVCVCVFVYVCVRLADIIEDTPYVFASGFKDSVVIVITL